MRPSIPLEQLLIQYVQSSQNRIMLISLMVMSMIRLRTVNLQEIALSLSPEAKTSSNYRRIQRFFADFYFEQEDVLRFVLAQLPSKREVVLCMDRTNWKFGVMNINILTIAIAYRGIAFPVLWMMLDKQGNSNQQERIALMRTLLKHMPVSMIKALVADREFIGQDWITFLHEQHIPYYIRTRKNILCEHEARAIPICALFAHVSVEQSLSLHNRYILFGQSVKITCLRLKLKDDDDDGYLILISNTNAASALAYYAQHWQIESLFKAMKSAGFDFEATHLRHLERIDTLLSLVTIALVWCHKIGEHLHRLKPIARKNHGYLTTSIFRLGLDFLRSVLFHLHRSLEDLKLCFSLLSCT